jgi:ankyrin repeat protein
MDETAQIKARKTLCLAAEDGDFENFQILWSESVSIIAEGSSEATALCFAAVQGGNMKIIDTLQAAGLNIDASCDYSGRGSKKYTTLHHAASYGHVALVRTLLDLGANVNQADNERRSPLHYAANNDNPYSFKIIKLLITAGAKIDHPDHDFNTPLLLAVKKINLQNMRILCAAGANLLYLNNMGQSPLSVAKYCDDFTEHGSCLDILLERPTTLHTAARIGNVAIVRDLLNAQVDVNQIDSQGLSPLYYAVENSEPEVVELLVQAGANIEFQDQYGEIPLSLAIEYRDHQSVKILVDAYKKQVDKHDLQLEVLIERPLTLHIAARTGNVAVVRALLGVHVNANQLDIEGISPLYYAAEHGQSEIVQLLVNAGAEIDFQDRAGNTPLLCAVREEHDECAEILVAAGADINKKNLSCFTPLLEAEYRARIKNDKNILTILQDYSSSGT